MLQKFANFAIVDSHIEVWSFGSVGIADTT